MWISTSRRSTPASAWARGRFEDLAAHHLAAITTTPIATPALARRLKLASAQDLRRATLIQVTTYPAAWSLWLEQAGVPELKPARTIAVDSFVAALQAAEQGAGVALGTRAVHRRARTPRRDLPAVAALPSHRKLLAGASARCATQSDAVDVQTLAPGRTLPCPGSEARRSASGIEAELVMALFLPDLSQILVCISHAASAMSAFPA